MKRTLDSTANVDTISVLTVSSWKPSYTIETKYCGALSSISETKKLSFDIF